MRVEGVWGLGCRNGCVSTFQKLDFLISEKDKLNYFFQWDLKIQYLGRVIAGLAFGVFKYFPYWFHKGPLCLFFFLGGVGGGV